MSYQVTLADSINPCLSNAAHFPSPRNFYAIGDSYSAGIGANCGWIQDDFDSKGECLKCDGAYPYQIIEVANTSACMEVYHVGCTGASMSDILETGWNNRTSQLELLASAPGKGGWGTLSIGGNDVGFANIVANCIMFDRPSCDADMNLTEALISDPLLISEFTTTYLAILGATTSSDFRLIVTGYAEFFNSITEYCDNKYFLYGRRLTREFRARVNKLVGDLNVVIQIAVALVQMQLVFANSQKMIYFEDWNSLFTGHRFCEEAPQTWADAWFFTINGPDTLPNGTTILSGTIPPPEQDPVNLFSISSTCNPDNEPNITKQMLCNWAQSLAGDPKSNGNVSSLVYPWWITKTMHPKSIAHRELAKLIYRHWMDGDYF